MLKLQNVTVVYPDMTKAVDDVTFTLSDGESIAIIGENGAGKTTLLLATVGILELAGGSIEMDGARLTPKTAVEIRKRIGLVFQNPDDQLFTPQIYDDVAFGCRNAGLPEDKVKERVDETLARLKINRLRDRSPIKLSAGEKRMAAIAAILAMNPSVLMLDEPTAFLDPKAKRALSETLNSLRHPKIVATHDIAFAKAVCNRVIALKNGRIAADGGLPLLDDTLFLRDSGL
jgi:cobalt/nickel transport system ATP-binding protein